MEKLEKEKISHSNLLVSNVMFATLAVAFISLSFLSSIVGLGFKTSVITIQYGIVLIPILIVMKKTNVDIKKAFRLNKIPFMTALKVALITLVSLPIAYFLNFLVTSILLELDLFRAQSLDIGTGTLNFFVMIFLISITPAICEEVFFRGMMLSGYESSMSPVRAALLTGLLFGLFHFNIQNLMLPTFLGVILAVVVRTSNSIYSGMLMHGIFNFIGLLIMYIPKDDIEVTAESTQIAIDLLKESMGIVLLVFGFLAVICSAFLVMLINWLKKDYEIIETNDKLIISNNRYEVKDLDDEFIIVKTQEDEVKKIDRKKLLNEISYKLLKCTNKEYAPIDKRNYVFVLFVVALYIAFTIFLYTR